jgi:hypothetical protein
VYLNRHARKISTVFRHPEINDFLAKKICKDIEVPAPSAQRLRFSRGAS